MLIDLLFEAALQPRFGRESANERQALNRLTQKPGQLTHLFLTAFSGGHDPSTEQTDQPHDQRRQQKDREGEFPVEPKHVAEHSHKLKGTGDRVVEGFVDDFADAVGVFGQAIGEVPSGKLLEGTEFHLLQLPKEIPAQALAHLQCRTSQQRVLGELSKLL